MNYKIREIYGCLLLFNVINVRKFREVHNFKAVMIKPQP